MIDFYYYKSPNGRKVLIALEELELAYRTHWVDISKGDQFHPRYLTISPAGKIPAIVDEGAGVALFESAAILVYLADLTGKLLPTSGPARYRTLSWLSWQIGSQGPMLGQAAHFLSHAPKAGITAPYAADRYLREAKRCYGVMEAHLAQCEWFGEDFSIADVALFPWTRTAKGHGIDLDEYPSVKAWAERIAVRPSASVKPAVELERGKSAGEYADAESRKNLFGEVFVKQSETGRK
jgi:GST-like protein